MYMPAAAPPSLTYSVAEFEFVNTELTFADANTAEQDDDTDDDSTQA